MQASVKNAPRVLCKYTHLSCLCYDEHIHFHKLEHPSLRSIYIIMHLDTKLLPIKFSLDLCDAKYTSANFRHIFIAKWIINHHQPLQIIKCLGYEQCLKIYICRWLLKCVICIIWLPCSYLYNVYQPSGVTTNQLFSKAKRVPGMKDVQFQTIMRIFFLSHSHKTWFDILRGWKLLTLDQLFDEKGISQELSV